MQLRAAPGGRTPRSRRRGPEGPAPGGKDPRLAARGAGGAAVIADGDDGRQVARALLEAAQEDGQAGAAADGDDLWPAGAVAEVVDRLEQALVARRAAHRGEEGDLQLPDAERDEAEGDADEEGAAHETRDELQCDVVHPVREGVVEVDLAQDVAEAEAHYRHAEQHQRQPALDVHAEVEPLDEASAAQGSHRLANYKASLPSAKPSARQPRSSSARSIACPSAALARPRVSFITGPMSALRASVLPAR